MDRESPVTSEDEKPTARYDWHRWYSVATTFVAPATFVSALLFYFGYVSSRSMYRYFGIDVDTVGLSTQQFIMRSPQALLVPAVLLALLAACAVLVRVAVHRRGVTPQVIGTVRLVGLTMAGIALVMMASYQWIGAWAAYPMVTPLLLAVGVGLVAWAGHRRGAKRTAVALELLVVAVAVFWATATLAEWTGRGSAQRTARNLADLPAVVLDTKERLYLGDGIVEETKLPHEDGQAYRYRYRGLRLLIQGGDTMFLVPSPWSASSSTLVVPVNGEVRVKFRFVDDPP